MDQTTLDLNLIAPDIQEELLFLPYINSSRQKLLKRNVRSIGVTTDWANQRLRWRQIHR